MLLVMACAMRSILPSINSFQRQGHMAVNNRKSFESADLFRLKFVEAADLSPDGKHVVYAVSEVDAEKEQQTSAIWLLSLDTGAAKRLSGSGALNTNPRWSPD